ncbi:MAG: heavy metal-associated domain-containing protein [Bdellovibrio sp.]
MNGMHCGGCVKNVEREVCKMEGVENCKVSLIDAKKQVGKVEFSVKSGTNVTSETVKDVVENKAGYQFAGPYKAGAQKKK